MERLTEKDGGLDFKLVDSDDFDTHTWCQYANEAVNRLAAYEDTGLEPADIPTGLELANVYAAMLKLKRYEALGTVEHLTELVEAEQKRREGCIRCERKTCGTCYRFGWHPDICQKCENQSHYSAKPFCAHCGRDLRGESREQH